MKSVIAVVVVFLLLNVAVAQEGSPVNPTAGPPQVAWTTLVEYDGSNNPIYVGKARSVQPMETFARSCGSINRCSTLTSIVDAANTATVNMTAHGLQIGNKVTVSGCTVDADLCGTYFIQTVPDANSFTYTSASVTDATYTEATLIVTTTAPRTALGIWSIMKISYTGTNAIRTQWAEGTTSPVNGVSIWDNRSTSTGATKVTFQ